MTLTRNLWCTLVALPVIAMVIFEIDRAALRNAVRETLSVTPSVLTESDASWWQEHVGPLPTDQSDPVNSVPIGITGGPALAGNIFHPNGGDGADGADADGRGWPDSLGSLEAGDLRSPAGHVVGRVVYSAERWAYRLTPARSALFADRWIVVNVGVQPANPADDRDPGAPWSWRPRYGRLLLVILPTLALIIGGTEILTYARRRARQRRLADRRASNLARSTPSTSPLTGALEEPCPKCGHAMQANENTTCPECGGDVGLPGCRGRLRYAHRRWLQRVLLGQRLLFIAVALGILANALYIVLFPMGFFLSHNASDYIERYTDLLASSLPPLTITGIAGALLLVSADPRQSGRPPRWSSRRMVHCALLLGLVALVVPFIASSVFSMLPILVIHRGGLALAFPLVLIGCLWRILECAERIPSPALVATCRRRQIIIAMIGPLNLLPAAFFILVVMQVNWTNTVLPDVPKIILLMVSPSVPMLLMLLAFISPLHRLRRDWADECALNNAL